MPLDVRDSLDPRPESRVWCLLVACVTFACAREAPRIERPERAPPAAAPAPGMAPPGASAAPPVQQVPSSSSGDGGRLAERYASAPALAVLSGKASYYADKFTGRSTASGEPYDPRAFTAAHRSLPFGTVVRVVRTDPPAAVYVKVNDRGPFVRGRVIDLSRAAAEALSMLRAGVIPVRVEILEYGPKPRPKKRRPRRRR
jgi:rare lipoprotein A